MLLNGIDGFRRRGGRIATDDTGAGYASFLHLLRLRPDIIKLDITLTRGIDADRWDRAHDELVELGSGRLIEGFEEQLEGASAGEERENAGPPRFRIGPRNRRERHEVGPAREPAGAVARLHPDLLVDDVGLLGLDVRRAVLEAEQLVTVSVDALATPRLGSRR